MDWYCLWRLDNNGVPDCCTFCYLDDCENYPTTYFVSEELEFDGPYDCDGNCSDLNLDGEYDDQDQDNICDMFDNCPNFWNPGQIDSDGDGLGDACEQNSTSLIEAFKILITSLHIFIILFTSMSIRLY